MEAKKQNPGGEERDLKARRELRLIESPLLLDTRELSGNAVIGIHRLLSLRFSLSSLRRLHSLGGAVFIQAAVQPRPPNLLP